MSTSQFINAELLDSTVGEKFCTTNEMISWNGQASEGLTGAASYLAIGLASWNISSLLSVEVLVCGLMQSFRFFPTFPSLRVLDFVDGPMDNWDGMKTRSY
jgi:hypothetical protein